VAPPLLLGVINKTKALFAGRRGPPLLQLYYDLEKLMRKGSAFSHTTTCVFPAGPVVGLAAVLSASLLVPLGAHEAPASFTGDLILFAYLLALSRFFTAAAALDTGSAFEGMGAARGELFRARRARALLRSPGDVEALRAPLSLSLSPMLASPWSAGWLTAGASLVLVAAGWFVVLLAENSRIPFDDPNTHLELMIHEVMVLDHSGLGHHPLRGGDEALRARRARDAHHLPLRDRQLPCQLGHLPRQHGALRRLVGTVESRLAQLRLLRVPPFLITACPLSVLLGLWLPEPLRQLIEQAAAGFEVLK
jgi:formate hydrogenlyase subunit 4